MSGGRTPVGLVRTLTHWAGWIVVVAAVLTAVPASHVSAREAILLEERLAQTVPERMSREGVSGLVIVLLRNGTLVWMEAFGMADPQAGRAMTPDALFRVESISKPVTAWGAMRLAETGRVDLDASLTECLADWQPPGGLPPITPRELLSHSAGIGLGDYAARYAPGAPRPGLTEHLAEDFSMAGWPLWAAMQDYLLLFSVLPSLWPWLAAASGLAGLSLAAVALTPERAR